MWCTNTIFSAGAYSGGPRRSDSSAPHPARVMMAGRSAGAGIGAMAGGRLRRRVDEADAKPVHRPGRRSGAAARDRRRRSTPALPASSHPARPGAAERAPAARPGPSPASGRPTIWNRHGPRSVNGRDTRSRVTFAIRTPPEAAIAGAAPSAAADSDHRCADEQTPPTALTGTHHRPRPQGSPGPRCDSPAGAILTGSGETTTLGHGGAGAGWRQRWRRPAPARRRLAPARDRDHARQRDQPRLGQLRQRLDQPRRGPTTPRRW